MCRLVDDHVNQRLNANVINHINSEKFTFNYLGEFPDNFLYASKTNWYPSIISLDAYVPCLLFY